MASVVATVGAKHARAADPCEIVLEGAAPAASWAQAVATLRPEVAHDSQCRRISVLVSATGAHVELTTTDGRSARRALADASELRRAVEALLVAWSAPAGPPVAGLEEPAELAPEDPTQARPGPTPTSLAPPASAPLGPTPLGLAPLAPRPHAAVEEPAATDARDAPTAEAPATGAPRHFELLLGAGAGARASAPGDSVAGIGQVYGGVALGRLELAGYGRWEIEHDVPGGPARGRAQLGAVGGGPMVGLRQPLPFATLLFGGRGGLFAVEMEPRREARARGGAGREAGETYLDPRLGLYAGAILFQRAPARLRLQAEADAGILAQRPELAGDGIVSRWSLGFSLSVEMGLAR